MELSDYFIYEYLTVGNAYDNCVFLGCNKEMLDFARNKLLEPFNNKVACVVDFCEQDEKEILKIISQFSDEIQKKLIVRDYVCLKILIEYLKSIGQDSKEMELLLMQLKSAEKGDIPQIHSACPLPEDIDMVFDGSNVKELVFINSNIKDKELQKAINTFLACRTNYCVKVFSNSKMLATYFDQSGHFIETPHDYNNVKFEHFLKKESEPL